MQGGQHLIPLGAIQIHAGGVVAAGVQHEHRTRAGCLDAVQHALEVHAVGGGVIVGVGFHLEAGCLEDGAVVLPAGIADVDGGALGAEAAQQVGADLQAAGAAQGLCGDGALVGDDGRVLAQQQLLHGLVIGGDAVDGQVAPGGMGGIELVFGLAHAVQQRQLAVLVVIDAHAQVDLGGSGVGIEGFGHAQDGIPGSEGDGGKQRTGHGAALLDGFPAPGRRGRKGLGRTDAGPGMRLRKWPGVPTSSRAGVPGRCCRFYRHGRRRRMAHA